MIGEFIYHANESDKVGLGCVCYVVRREIRSCAQKCKVDNSVSSEPAYNSLNSDIRGEDKIRKLSAGIVVFLDYQTDDRHNKSSALIR